MTARSDRLGEGGRFSGGGGWASLRLLLLRGSPPVRGELPPPPCLGCFRLFRFPVAGSGRGAGVITVRAQSPVWAGLMAVWEPVTLGVQ